MPEFDVILMSLVIFVPTVWALVLMVPWFFPRGSEEIMRWWSLLGTAVTLVLSIVMFINYYHRVYDFNRADESKSLLESRVEQARAAEQGTAPRLGSDWVARYPWIKQFNIDYFLGA